MRNKSTDYVVAPSMGDFEEGIQRFKGIKPPYARGGGTPATKLLEAQVLKYVAKWDVHTQGRADPAIAIVSSGQAANHTVFRALQGTHMVSSSHLFGTTKVDLKMSFMRTGGQITWVDPCDTQAFIDNSAEDTSAWFLEAISNPAGRVPDFASLRSAAKERDILLILDTTLTAGMPKFRGLDHADILTVSLTKQAGGGDNRNVGGAVIVNSDYAWHKNAEKFPELRAYFANAAGDLVLPDNPFGALVSKISLHEGSGVIAPQNAISIARSLPGMERRVLKQSNNAAALADILNAHAAVKSVQLAGRTTDQANDHRANYYLGNNHFVLLVDLAGGAAAAEKFINSGAFAHAVALGQKTTAVSHPPSSTHRQYSKEDLAGMGIYDGTIRISVGTEPRKELLKKLAYALT